jgi:acylphosphatase
VFLIARGKVQEVMFRKTLLYGALKYFVSAGGTNSQTEGDRVDLTVSGAPDKVEAFIAALQPGRKLNSIGAEILSIERVNDGRPIESHISHTGQGTSVSPPSGVEFYI